MTSRQKHKFITESKTKKKRKETSDDRRVFTIETVETELNPPSGHDATRTARHCGYLSFFYITK